MRAVPTALDQKFSVATASVVRCAVGDPLADVVDRLLIQERPDGPRAFELVRVARLDAVKFPWTSPAKAEDEAGNVGCSARANLAWRFSHRQSREGREASRGEQIIAAGCEAPRAGSPRGRLLRRCRRLACAPRNRVR